MRKFYELHPSDLQTTPTGTFPKQLDGAGVLRGMTTTYWVMYDQTAGHVQFRNMLCACTPCMAGTYKDCVCKLHVSPPLQAKFTCLTMQPESDDELDDVDDADFTATGDLSDMEDEEEDMILRMPVHAMGCTLIWQDLHLVK